MVKGWSVRQEKVIYGSMSALTRTYIMNGKNIGGILKNPYTDKYEVTASDFINHTIIEKEFVKFSDAKQFLMNYQMSQIKKGINEERKKIMVM